MHQQSITYGPISSRKRQYHKIDTTTLPPPFTQTCKARVHCQQYVHLNTVLCSLPQMATCNTMVLCPKKTIAMPTIAMRALKTVLANCGGSLYIEAVHMVGALFDHYHQRPYRAVRFNDHSRTEEDIHKS